MKLTGESRSTRGKTCPSATLSTTNPTWPDQGSNPGLLGERPATNRLSHGTVRIGLLCFMSSFVIRQVGWWEGCHVATWRLFPCRSVVLAP
jgi:hypothetical protein